MKLLTAVSILILAQSSFAISNRNIQKMGNMDLERQCQFISGDNALDILGNISINTNKCRAEIRVLKELNVSFFNLTGKEIYHSGVIVKLNGKNTFRGSPKDTARFYKCSLGGQSESIVFNNIFSDRVVVSYETGITGQAHGISMLRRHQRAALADVYKLDKKASCTN